VCVCVCVDYQIMLEHPLSVPLQLSTGVLQ